MKQRETAWERITMSVIDKLPMWIMAGIVFISTYMIKIDKRISRLEDKFCQLESAGVTKLEFKTNLGYHDALIKELDIKQQSISDRVDLLYEAHKLTTRGEWTKKDTLRLFGRIR